MKISNSISRRRLFRLIGAGSLTGLAGCNRPTDESPSTDEREATSQKRPSPTSSSTHTVIFTDSPKPTTPPRSIVFDGGGTPAFREAAQTAADLSGATLEIEPGTYRISPVGYPNHASEPHIQFQDLDKLTVNGNGATLEFTDPTLAGFDFVNCSETTLQNLSLDFNPLPFTQGKITAVDESNRQLTVEIDDGYSSLDHRIFDVATKVWASVHTPDGEFVQGIRADVDPDKHFSSIEQIDSRTFLLKLMDWASMDGLQQGRRLAIVAREHHSLLRFYKCSRPTLNELNLHASKGMTASFQVCSKPTVTNCVIEPLPDSNRLIASNADGVSFVNCLSEPTVENCRFEYLEDDGIVVQHTTTKVNRIVDEHTIEVGNFHPVVAKVGDLFEAISPGGVRKGTLPPVADLEFVFPPVGGREKRGKPSTIGFEDPVDEILAVDDLIGNLATASLDFTIRNNTLRNHRARLIRIAASHGQISTNTLSGSNDSVIKLESENTVEPFSPKAWIANVTIEDNEISRPGMNYFAGSEPSGIRINHVPAPDYPSNGRPNRNITIRNNVIRVGAKHGMFLSDAAGLSVEGNEIADVNRLDYSGFGSVGFKLTNLGDTTLEGNTLVDGTNRTEYFAVKRDSGELTTRNNEFLGQGEGVSPNIVRLAPVTLSFNRVVHDGRWLSFLCRDLELLDNEKKPMLSVDVGTEERGLEFGTGVYRPERFEEQTWRWFGNNDKTTKLYFADNQLNEAAYLKLRGEPYEAGLSAKVRANGEVTDQVDFGPRNTSTYLVSLG